MKCRLKKYGHIMLQYIHQDNITEDICITAILQNCMALDYVKEQSEEICKVSVQLDGNALNYVRNQTEELCKLAVQENGNSLQYVKIEQTDEICKLFITICKESN